MGWIQNLIAGSPSGQFSACCLQTGYLLQGSQHIYLRVLRTAKRQLPHIIVGMLAHV
jgi:hypothetical protein